MKRIISLLLALTLCLSCVFALASCNPKDIIAKIKGEDTSSDANNGNNAENEEPKHPILEYYEKMENMENNYKLTMTLSDVPYFGIATMVVYVDGNLEYWPETMFNVEEYTETVGNKKYSYTKNDYGKWIKTSVTDESSEDSELLAEKLFDYNNYEAVEGKANVYRQKAGVDLGEYSNVVFTLAENSFTIEMTVEEDGMVMGMTIIVSNFGESNVTLPKVS